MRKLRLNNGDVIKVKDKEVIEVISITQTTFSKKRNEGTLSFKDIDKIAKHFDTSRENVLTFLEYNIND